MKRYGKTGLRLLLALLIAFVCEICIFNRQALFSGSRAWEPLPAPEVTGDLAEDKQVKLTFSHLDREISRCHILIEVWDAEGMPAATQMTVAISDEGNLRGYEAGTVSYYPGHDKGAYFSLHSYGRVQNLVVTLTAPSSGCSYTLRAAEVNGSMPWRLSVPRIVGIFALLALLYFLRPGAPVHDNRLWNRRRWVKLLCVVLVLLVNFALLAKLSLSDDDFVQISPEARWDHHRQYARLARALTEGRTWVETPEQEELLQVLGELDNPYDRTQRSDAFRDHPGMRVWDSAYYNGHLYVYFGVVPVLLTYLPYYLLTGRDMPTVLGAILAYGAILGAAWLLMRGVIRRYFPKTPFTAYCLLSVLLGNGTGALCYTLESSFYTLPITFALALVMLALSLWLSAAELLARGAGGRSLTAGEKAQLCFAPAPREPRRGAVGLRLALGSLCAALVAGCRPQFLVFSALAIPVFLPLLRDSGGKRLTLGRALAFLLPYGAVAALLMYYNHIRFGSVFDFGANYNLTTNDMTHRGWTLARLPDGLFAYFLCPPRVTLHFPYLQDTALPPIYLGRTVQEGMFGGVLVIFPFLWSLCLLGRRWGSLRRRQLLGLSLLPLGLALVVAAADTEMAGILWRYTGDFLLLLYLPAVLIVLTGLEEAPAHSRGGKVFRLALVTVFTLALCLLISVSASTLDNRDPESFYRLKDFLSWI